jgi:hypothetical protein
MKNEYIIALVAGILLVGGTVYYLTLPKPKTTSSSGNGSGSTTTTTTTPSISCQTTSITISQGLLGDEYFPSSITISGSGFTSLGTYVIYGEDGSNLYQGNVSNNGTFSQIIQVSEFSPTPGVYKISAQDVSTNTLSNQIEINIISSSSTGNGSSGTGSSSTGNGSSGTGSSSTALPSSEWNPNSTYMSNTNPVALGNWAIKNVGANWYGPGWYQVSTTTEKYFGSASQLDAEYNTLYPQAPLGSKSNPYSLASWEGPGYYSAPGTAPVEIETKADYNNYMQYGQQVVYSFSAGWQGSGYYTFSSSQLSKLVSEPASGITQSPSFIGTQAFYNSVNNYLNQSTSTTSGSSNVTLSASTSTVSLNSTFQIYVSGLQPGEYYVLYNNEGIAMTKSLDVNTINYDLTSDSPIYISLQDGYNEFYVNTTNGTITSNKISLTLSSSTQSAPSSNAVLTSNTSSIQLVNGQSITFIGTGFKPNVNYEIIASSSNGQKAGIQIGGGTTSSIGEFAFTATYTETDSSVSPLFNAFNQTGTELNYIYVYAQDYVGDVTNFIEITGYS